jgi:hypothetical protein
MYLSWIEYVATNYSVGGSNPSLPENKLDYTFMAFAKITYSGAKNTINPSKQNIRSNEAKS